MKKTIFATTIALISFAGVLNAKEARVYSANISEAEVLSAQKAWGDALVAISTEFKKGGQKAASVLAGKVIDQAYGYNLGPVLFKPTLTEAPQTFRIDRAGALAYFVGGDKNYPNDTGFALKGWTKVAISNVALHINGDVATTMGNVMLTNKDGTITTVDKTWTFKKTDDGKLRIVLHHSSLPFSN
jgi:hypothetical protein